VRESTFTGASDILLAELQSATRKATQWVLAQQAPSGVIGDPNLGFKYYRGPWSLALVGETEAALALCRWIRANLERNGRLDTEMRVLEDGWAYRDSVLIVGAHMLHQYDLSLGLVDSMVSWQDPISGGFANDRMPDGTASDEMDIPYAAGPGFALLATGRMAEARRVAAFLEDIYAAQERLPERFYCFWSRSGQQLVTEKSPAFQDRFVVESQADRMQRWTIGGIAAGFLGRLYLADPDPSYLELARLYQEFSMNCTDAQFKYPSVCKSSWGAALLYQITGEDKYREWLHRMARWYLDTQEPEGWWHPWVEKTSADVIEITLEFIMHIEVLAGALASRSENE
jgi:hypothetical protein